MKVQFSRGRPGKEKLPPPSLGERLAHEQLRAHRRAVDLHKVAAILRHVYKVRWGA